MALFEYFCLLCKKKFEQIIRPSDRQEGICPTCGQLEVRKMISRFWVGGRGDLRESTLHGCHEASVGFPSDQSSDLPGRLPDHEHSHAEESHHPTAESLKAAVQSAVQSIDTKSEPSKPS